mgnify:CR=1 FL=1|jgi:hypothetical protein
MSKRLTQRNEKGEAYVQLYSDPDRVTDVIAERAKKEKEVIERLAHYEDLEDAGRLKIFPCAIGDTIWIPLKNLGRFTGEIVEDKIQMIGFTSKGIRIKARKHHAHNITLKLGESVFLTRKSAEAALKECEQE